jgi:hypothetical protein
MASFEEKFKAWLARLNLTPDKAEALWQTFQQKQKERLAQLSLDECERLMVTIESRRVSS